VQRPGPVRVAVDAQESAVVREDAIPSPMSIRPVRAGFSSLRASGRISSVSDGLGKAAVVHQPAGRQVGPRQPVPVGAQPAWRQ
jgi:hypothetical protein